MKPSSENKAAGDGTLPIRLEQLRVFCVEAMERSGMGEPDAGTAADVLVTTDAWGIHSHGQEHYGV